MPPTFSHTEDAFDNVSDPDPDTIERRCHCIDVVTYVLIGIMLLCIFAYIVGHSADDRSARTQSNFYPSVGGQALGTSAGGHQ